MRYYIVVCDLLRMYDVIVWACVMRACVQAAQQGAHMSGAATQVAQQGPGA
jgi:hypothetical protein